VGKYSTTGEATVDNKYGACAFHAGYLKLQTHTLGMCNTYYLSTAIVAAQRASLLRQTCFAWLITIMYSNRSYI